MAKLYDSIKQAGKYAGRIGLAGLAALTVYSTDYSSNNNQIGLVPSVSAGKVFKTPFYNSNGDSGKAHSALKEHNQGAANEDYLKGLKEVRKANEYIKEELSPESGVQYGGILGMFGGSAQLNEIISENATNSIRDNYWGNSGGSHDSFGQQHPARESALEQLSKGQKELRQNTYLQYVLEFQEHLEKLDSASDVLRESETYFRMKNALVEAGVGGYESVETTQKDQEVFKDFMDYFSKDRLNIMGVNKSRELVRDTLGYAIKDSKEAVLYESLIGELNEKGAIKPHYTTLVSDSDLSGLVGELPSGITPIFGRDQTSKLEDSLKWQRNVDLVERDFSRVSKDNVYVHFAKQGDTFTGMVASKQPFVPQVDNKGNITNVKYLDEGQPLFKDDLGGVPEGFVVGDGYNLKLISVDDLVNDLRAGAERTGEFNLEFVDGPEWRYDDGRIQTIYFSPKTLVDPMTGSGQSNGMGSGSGGNNGGGSSGGGSQGGRGGGSGHN